MKKLLIFCLSLLLLSACQSIKTQTYDLLLTNATIVDVQTGTLIPDQLIAISGDTIRVVDAAENLAKYTATQTLDAQGKYVMPGLWDMHVHFRGGDTLLAENKDFLALFLAYGVTTVRDAGGDLVPSVMQWREQIRKGELAGPTIFTPGPKLDGPKPAWPGSITVDNEADMQHALDSLQALGVDYVKMYDGSLTKESFYSIIKEAEKRGLKTTGHMPLSADILPAVDLGLDGSEHMYYVLKAASPLADSLTKLNLSYGMMNQIVESYDSALATKVFEKLAANDFYITPTLHIGKTLAELADADHSRDSLLAYIGKGVQQTYQGRLESAKRAKARGNDMRQQMGQLTERMMRPMYDAGINLVAGSDSGPFNSFVYPGESLHEELKSMVAAGLTPQQALTTSVINGPKFFGLGAVYGSISSAKIADILILDANPLEDISNTSKLHTVIKAGKVYDRAALNAMLERIKAQK